MPLDPTIEDLERRLAEAEAAAARAEERSRNLIERNADGIVIVDAGGTILFVNPAAEALFGRPADRLLGHPFGFPTVAGSTAEIDVVRPGAATGAAPGITSVASAEMRVVETTWEHRPAFLASLRDVTRRRALEEQLRQSQKMEAVGRLAGGIAHDFNNLLTAISGYTDLILARVDGDPSLSPVRDDVHEIRQAADRAAGLTRQLLTFSRRRLLRPQVFDVREVVRGLESMLRRMIGPDVELAVRVDGGECPVQADRGQIEQVLLNLAVNARDAMPSGGRLLIEARNLPADGPAAADDFDGSGASAGSDGPADSGQVLLGVSDTGEGMAPETVGRIFEPFFTTKGPDKGTGLGLSIVYGIVQQCGGRIRVDSQPGRGTRFDILLPRSRVPAGPESPRPSGPPAAGAATVLLVEDLDSVRLVARRLLKTAGYTVLEAAGGPEAIELSERVGGRIDLLVTDVVMPGMSGRELVDRLLPRWPTIRILFMSGFARDEALRDGPCPVEAHFIQKPFTLDQFLGKVRDALDGNAERAVGSTGE